MGQYINKGNSAFNSSRNGEYVDKSMLISMINGTLYTRNRFTCMTRCRRFGKSMAAEMLAAYYDQSCGSRELFADLAIASDPSFEQHLNRYPVIYLDMTRFVTRFKDDGIVHHIEEELKAEVKSLYPQVEYKERDDLMDCLLRIAAATGQLFIFIIDEWDAICRESAPATKTMDEYVNWLRGMFKSSSALDVFAGVYMTGILPIKKYKTESALNNFREFSMTMPGRMGGFFGFTKEEVKALAAKYHADYDELEKWYDGYQIGNETSVFNPNSVMLALDNGSCDSYWASTGAFDAVAAYIQMNFEGLKDDIIRMLAGGRCDVDTTGFQNDISIIRTKDDVLTVLIHLGYLAFDWVNKECYIPNKEVAGEMVNAIKTNNWKCVVDALQQSKQLLADTLSGDCEAVANGIEAVHDESTSVLSYNSENSLACVISLAYYYAKNDYIVHREYPSGKGFADLVLIPRKNVHSPALVIELKYDRKATTAISQIKQKDYPAKIAEYAGNILLVGINYDKKEKKHSCMIEKA